MEKGKINEKGPNHLLLYQDILMTVGAIIIYIYEGIAPSKHSH